MVIMSEQMDDMEGLEELEVMFIAETFHKSEPIRAKPEQTIIPCVWIKDRPKKVKNINGICIKVEPQPKVTLHNRFTQLVQLRGQAGVHFETDEEEEDDGDEEGDGDDDDFEDIQDSGKDMRRRTKNNIGINLAKKLKKRAIANRLGVAYNPGQRTRGLGTRLGAVKSWSEKFGRLLAAKKLLYLPLLFRKYKMGPNRTKDELDYEIDLYMAEVKTSKKSKLGLDSINSAINGSDDGNGGIKVVNSKEVFGGGFGGPDWSKRIIQRQKSINKDTLDMDLDQYMAAKDRAIIINGTDGSGDHSKSTPGKEDLDVDLDNYMASVKNETNNRLIVNGYH